MKYYLSFNIISFILLILGIIFFSIDYNRVKNNERPLFCIKPDIHIADGGTVEFFGLGYKVIDFHTLGGYDEIKIGTWFMDYNDFDDERQLYEKQFQEKQKELYGDYYFVKNKRK